MAVLDAIEKYLRPRTTARAPLAPAERLARQRVLAAERERLAAEKERAVQRHAPHIAAAQSAVDQARAELRAAILRLEDIAREARTETLDLDRSLTAVEGQLRTLADPVIGEFLADLRATLERGEAAGLKLQRSIGWGFDSRRREPFQVKESNSTDLAEVLAEFRAVHREVEGLVLEPIAQDELLERLAGYRGRLIAFAAARGFRVTWQAAAA